MAKEVEGGQGKKKEAAQKPRSTGAHLAAAEGSESCTGESKGTFWLQYAQPARHGWRREREREGGGTTCGRLNETESRETEPRERDLVP